MQIEIVEELERRVGRPVVTSNQATVWATQRQFGIAQKTPAFGTLFTQASD